MAGLTQQQLAERAGLPERTISDLEQGVSAQPDPGSIQVLRKALGLSKAQADEMAGLSRYRMHDLLRAYASELAAAVEGEQAGREALARLFGYEKAIAAPGWVASAKARLLADEVALVIAVTRRQDFADDPHYARVIAGAQEEAARNGLQLSVHVGAGGSASNLPPFGGDKRFLGAVLVNVPAMEAAFLAKLGRPVVSMGASAAGVPSVGPRNHDGAAEAVGHLLASGRRRIVSIAGPQYNPCARERLAGYQSRVGAAGLREVVVITDFTRADAAKATRRLLHTHPDLDAIFVASDFMATAALQVLAASGRQIPGDVAVAGFDDSAPALMTTPSLTTVHHTVEELAALAVRTLLAPASARPDDQRLPVRLVVRTSSTS